LKENFDRFNFAIYKEKEMQFRRWFIVLSVLVLCAGLAAAQTSPLVCQAGQSSVTPLVRAEGYTELVGDIVITCTGGTGLAADAAVPQANITVSMNAPVTSRLLGNNGSTLSSEALLMIDEPASGSQTVCPTPAMGCAATANGTGGYASGYNVYQGLVAGNQIVFNGVPVVPPGTVGAETVLRITNIRIAAEYIGAPAGFSFAQAQAAIASNNSTALPLGAAIVTVGFVNNSLKPSFTASSPFKLCDTRASKISNDNFNGFAGTVNFAEQFATAFKTRIAPMTGVLSYTSGATNQNTPGIQYNSESGFVLSSVTGNGATAGLADFGTRLKAVFTNIPSTVTGIWVAVNNNTATPPTTPGDAETTSYAQLVTGEAATTGSVFGGINAFPAVTGSASVGSTSVAQIYNGTGTQAEAVWEVLNTDPNSDETFSFNVYVTYAGSQSATAAAGVGQVFLGYAPSPNTNFTGLTSPFTAAQAAQAWGSSVPIPRFVDPTSAGNFVSFNLCQTVLLWPYVTSATGFNTGIAVSNTSMDPGAPVSNPSTTGFNPDIALSNTSRDAVAPPRGGATAQSGTCTMYVYGHDDTGAALSATPFVTPTIVAGDTYAAELTDMFSGTIVQAGYIFGVCNFEYAHGYAAVSDNQLANFVTSYLALVVTPPSGFQLSRGVAGESYKP